MQVTSVTTWGPLWPILNSVVTKNSYVSVMKWSPDHASGAASSVKETPVHADGAASAVQGTPVHADGAASAVQGTPVHADGAASAVQESPVHLDGAVEHLETGPSNNEKERKRMEKNGGIRPGKEWPQYLAASLGRWLLLCLMLRVLDRVQKYIAEQLKVATPRYIFIVVFVSSFS
jgi:hypothetical protein